MDKIPKCQMLKQVQHDKVRTGFTLAEVLITLVIIGVIAALTIPNLMKNYQKKWTVSSLKQTYSLIYQAFQMSETANGPLSSWDIPKAGFDANAYTQGKIFFEQYLKPYLKIAKECKYLSNDCWADEYIMTNGGVSPYFSANYNNTYTVVLANGSVISIWPRGNWGEIYVDLNGKKKPNAIGKDAFDITFYKTDKNRIRFYDLDNASYNCTKTGRGYTCGAKIMSDNWEIKDDYPW